MLEQERNSVVANKKNTGMKVQKFGLVFYMSISNV